MKIPTASESDLGATRSGTGSGAAVQSLADNLARHTTVGQLWRTENGRIRCLACGHRCLIGEGRRGICHVRFNLNGELRVPFGYVAGLQCDPVDRKSVV